LRTGLWNVFYAFWVAPAVSHNSLSSDQWVQDPYYQMYQQFWVSFFKLPIDECPDQLGHSEWVSFFREHFRRDLWFQIYDMLEATLQFWNGADLMPDEFCRACNAVLEREKSGYRFIGMKLARITSEAEVQAIEGALSDTEPLPGAQHHLHQALSHFANRENPDYANSIKESISAVESVCRAIVGRKPTLGKAIGKLKDHGVEVHPTLEKAWDSLYGYTSDEGGIRHAAQAAPGATAEDAAYFLASCSAFVNLLIAKAGKAGIELVPR
jgi:hypothetical protein